MTTKNLIEAFATWSAEERPLVLASVFETAGSTYSKCGALMLITDDGRFQGMLSGGCLEGDLALRAKSVAEQKIPQAVTYDLGQSDEELWGLGVGCDGLMNVFLQPLLPDDNYEPFAAIAKAYATESEHVATIVIDSENPDLAAGVSSVVSAGDCLLNQVPAEHRQRIATLANATLAAGRSSLHDIEVGSHRVRILCALLRPPPQILVLGGGLDAKPVIRFAKELGWRVTAQDHRPAYVNSGNISDADAAHCLPVADISSELDLDRYAAAIVMSHHLASDRAYLAQLADSAIGYIGLLGPVDRRRTLVDELGELAVKLDGRLQGPAGLDIGGRGPASIALSIVAGMHQALAGKL